MINRATLTGRLTRNVDLRYTPSGVAVGNFTLAVDRNFLNRNGQRGTDFIRCVIWRKPAENFANFTHKGSLVGLDGQIRTHSYQNQQGERVYVTEVVVENFALLESKRQSQAQGQPNGPANQVNNNAPQGGNQNQTMNPFAPKGGNQSNYGPKPNNGNAPAGGSKPSNKPNHPNHNGNGNKGGNHKDPFANSGNKKIDISDDDLPF